MKKSILYLLIAIPVLFACRKKEANKFDGPGLNDVYGAFSVITPLSANKDSVNFSTGETVSFSAVLSKITDWEITIIGKTSGAIKRMNGTSSTIDASAATWIGNTTEFPMFQAENCDVLLTFKGQSDTLTTEIKIIQPKLNPGFLISDFETGLNPGWTSFIQSGADMDFQLKTDSSAAQGNSYYNMAGIVNWDWLIGLVNFNASAYGAPHFPVTSNSDDLYFNVLVFGEKNFANTLIEFQFDEDDNNNSVFNVVNGVPIEDRYTFQVPINWVGWKLVSLKYSDLTSSGTGNSIKEPHKIIKINLLDLANPVSGLAKTKIDYIILTENAPLNP